MKKIIKRLYNSLNEIRFWYFPKKEKKVFCIGLHKTGTTSLSKALNILGVVATETINEDMLDHFNINITSHEKKNKKNIKFSEKSRKNIIKYLKSDYTMIDNLFKHNLISEKQYLFLSKTTLE